MPILSDDLLNHILQWQLKRYVNLNAAIDSTKRLEELSKGNDEESVNLELDIRGGILDELQSLDYEFDDLTYELSKEDVERLLKRDEEEGISTLENSLRIANRNSFELSYKLIDIDKQFNLNYGKDLSIYN